MIDQGNMKGVWRR